MAGWEGGPYGLRSVAGQRTGVKTCLLPAGRAWPAEVVLPSATQEVPHIKTKMPSSSKVFSDTNGIYRDSFFPPEERFFVICD